MCGRDRSRHVICVFRPVSMDKDYYSPLWHYLLLWPLFSAFFAPLFPFSLPCVLIISSVHSRVLLCSLESPLASTFVSSITRLSPGKMTNWVLTIKHRACINSEKGNYENSKKRANLCLAICKKNLDCQKAKGLLLCRTNNMFYDGEESFSSPCIPYFLD